MIIRIFSDIGDYSVCYIEQENGALIVASRWLIDDCGATVHKIASDNDYTHCDFRGHSDVGPLLCYLSEDGKVLLDNPERSNIS